MRFCALSPGLVKLSLHEFYLAFYDQSTLVTVLRSDLPTIASNGYRPIYNLFENNEVGELRIMLAMGSRRQTTAWLGSAVPAGLVPHDAPEDAAASASEAIAAEVVAAARTLHVFEVSVQAASKLDCFQSRVPGESNCFVQYQFPESTSLRPGSDRRTPQPLNSQPHRSPIAVSAPDVEFGATLVHTISLHRDIDVAEELSTVIPNGITFDVWERVQYPRAKEVVVGRGLLALEVLSRLVGDYQVLLASAPAQSRTGDGVRCTYEVPVSFYGGGATARPDITGTLVVDLTYRASGGEVPTSAEAVLTAAAAPAASENAVVFSLSACAGLQSAAEVVARHDPSVTLAVDLGVNAFFKMRLMHRAPSDTEAEPAEPAHTTAVINGSFCPEFRDKGVLKGAGDTLVLELWHKRPPSSLLYSSRSGSTSLNSVLAAPEVLLARAAVPLPRNAPGDDSFDLLVRRGWYPLQSAVGGGHQPPVGAVHVELSGFPVAEVRAAAHDGNYSADGSHLTGPVAAAAAAAAAEAWDAKLSVGEPAAIRIETAKVAFTAAPTEPLDVWVEYEFWGSLVRSPASKWNRKFSYDVSHCHLHRTVVKPATARAMCCEQLQIKVVAAPTGGGAGVKPRLIGSAFVDVSAVLSGAMARPCRYPVITTDAVRMPDAYVELSIALEEAGAGAGAGPPVVQGPDDVMLDIAIEQAAHLPLVNDSGSASACPNTYVSYQLGGDSQHVICTNVIAGSRSPRWNHRDRGVVVPNGRLDLKAIVFKLWHKAEDSGDQYADRLIGFATTDLRPLGAGFAEISGWYHLTDFKGTEQGQLKVRIVPNFFAPTSNSYGTTLSQGSASAATPSFVPAPAALPPARLAQQLHTFQHPVPVSPTRPIGAPGELDQKLQADLRELSLVTRRLLAKHARLPAPDDDMIRFGPDVAMGAPSPVRTVGDPIAEKLASQYLLDGGGGGAVGRIPEGPVEFASYRSAPSVDAVAATIGATRGVPDAAGLTAGADADANADLSYIDYSDYSCSRSDPVGTGFSSADTITRPPEGSDFQAPQLSLDSPTSDHGDDGGVLESNPRDDIADGAESGDSDILRRSTEQLLREFNLEEIFSSASPTSESEDGQGDSAAGLLLRRSGLGGSTTSVETAPEPASAVGAPSDDSYSAPEITGIAAHPGIDDGLLGMAALSSRGLSLLRGLRASDPSSGSDEPQQLSTGLSGVASASSISDYRSDGADLAAAAPPLRPADERQRAVPHPARLPARVLRVPMVQSSTGCNRNTLASGSATPGESIQNSFMGFQEMKAAMKAVKSELRQAATDLQSSQRSAKKFSDSPQEASRTQNVDRIRETRPSCLA